MLQVQTTSAIVSDPSLQGLVPDPSLQGLDTSPGTRLTFLCMDGSGSLSIAERHTLTPGHRHRITDSQTGKLGNWLCGTQIGQKSARLILRYHAILNHPRLPWSFIATPHCCNHSGPFPSYKLVGVQKEINGLQH